MLEKVKPNFADNIWGPMNQSGLLGVSSKFIKKTGSSLKLMLQRRSWYPKAKWLKEARQKPSAFSLSLSPSKYFFILVFVSFFLSSYLCPSLSLSLSSKHKFKTDLDFPHKNKPKKTWFSKNKFKTDLDSPRLGGDIQHLPHSARNCLSVAEVWVVLLFFYSS